MKFTKMERNWVMYDVGNSALVLLNTSIVPIYFNAINTGASSAELVTAWANAQTVASLIVALLMPILGSLADYAGNKIKFFTGFFLTGVVLCLAQAIPMSAMAFLVVYVLCTIGLNSSMTFYDAMLPDVTTDERMDRVSSSGFAWGYVGSTIPFILCIALIFGGPSILGLDTLTCTRLTFIITGAWWLAFTVPLLRTYQQRYGKEREHGAQGVLHNIAKTFTGLLDTCRRIAHDRVLLVFMIAFFFYIDGVHTVISMATSYGAALGIDSTQLVLALLVTQFVAFPSAIIYGKAAGKFGTLRMIIFGQWRPSRILFAAFFLKSATEFWILAILVGMFQGGVQALSRSYFGKIIPKEHSNEYYGFFDIFGRYASVMGTLLVSVVTSLTHDPSLGVLSIGILLVVGFVMLVKLSSMQKAAA